MGSLSLILIGIEDKMKATKKGNQNIVEMEVVNPGSSIAISIKLNICDAETGELILLAYFSEGYFT